MTTAASTPISGRNSSVVATLNVRCALAICLEIISSSSPDGDIAATNLAIKGVNHMKMSVPTTLNIIWESAVRLAFMLPPIEASRAVVVEPIFVPNRIGIAPARPIRLLTPSGPAVLARF